MELFYTDPEHITSMIAEFDRFESQHILKTLRKKAADEIHFTDGRGRLYSGIIDKTRPVLKVRHTLVKESAPAAVSISLAVGFIRPARMDFIIEKGTELGVQKFYLLSTRHSNYFTANTLRWQKIARQAIKQSLRLFLPDIIAVTSLNEFIPLLPQSSLRVVFEQSATRPLSEILCRPDSLSSANIIFLIGPEGGWSPEETEFVQRNDFQPVSLGPYRLRTETAALLAAAAGILIN
jgi:16S rRNA (uracil1498-N3)-methyltransferase